MRREEGEGVCLSPLTNSHGAPHVSYSHTARTRPRLAKGRHTWPCWGSHPQLPPQQSEGQATQELDLLPLSSPVEERDPAPAGLPAPVEAPQTFLATLDDRPATSLAPSLTSCPGVNAEPVFRRPASRP